MTRSHKYYSTGFKLGSKEFDETTGKPQYHLNNHFTIVVRWKDAPGSTGKNGRKIVLAFEIYPKSVDVGQRNATGCPLDIAADHKPLVLDIGANATDLSEQYPDSSYIPEQVVDMYDGATMAVPTTYSVYFRETADIEWEHRWDLYFNDQAEASFTHWLAIVNSLIISGILGAICIVIWARTMQGDVKGKGDGVLEEARLRIKKKTEKKKGSGLLDKPNDAGLDDDLSSDDEFAEDVTGWKLLHGDVFRPPPYGGLLAPLVGSGMQLVFMVAGLLLLSCVGVLNPSWRGGFVSVGVGLFVFAGGFSGYFSGRVYKTFGGQNHRKNTLLVSRHCMPKNFANKIDRSASPRSSIRFRIRTQPLYLGSSVINSFAFLNPCGTGLPLAPNTAPSGSCLLWLWIPIISLGASHQN